ncbi:serine/threonine-protein kinase ATM isoform X2 [Solanum dulcamara]|uniref:serine/threonine-protein kinase ATM isoform X2 n=1 Tax=Solanum dulcamara TaxID=45834 RepID=UPI002486AF2B|nr:serine/threonine-protein kinase ATM isoform X2 [Solanum dulcamara]
MVTSRDIQDIVSKLSSDKAKSREEGIKLLNAWLEEGQRSVEFCRYIGEKTARLKPDEIPHSETWPFLVTLLTKCVSLEISAGKKRLPKLNVAKTLRIVVQRAEDAKFSGKDMPLLSVAKLLFNHVWDVLKDIPSFQSEYGTILRHLLAVRTYRFHLRKRVYCCLVLLYMEKVEISLQEKSDGQINPREEVFRCITTLHSLLENPPGDFPDTLREDIVRGFIGIFSNVRDEGKISRKLIECINIYLLKDGPNLGSKSLEIHDALQHFVFRCWMTTHDRGLKDSLVLYARLQLNLTRDLADGSSLLEQLQDVLGKELDQMSSCTINLPWKDTTRDDKCGSLTSSQCGLMELAALVFCRACVSTPIASSSDKRIRREHVVVQIWERLSSGKWPWHAVFCYLIHKYYDRLKKDLLIYWFEGICANFERIINDANMEHSYVGLLWTLRSLQGLSLMLLFPVPALQTSSELSSTLSGVETGWHTIWNCVTGGLPTFSTFTAVVDAALMLLRNLILNDTTNAYFVPQDLWDLRLLKRVPSISVLCFISCYFSRKCYQGDLRDTLYLRQNLLRAVLAFPFWKERSILNKQLVAVLPTAVYALCTGGTPLLDKGLSPSHYIPETVNDVKVEDHTHESVHDLFECSVEVLARIGQESDLEDVQLPCCQSLRLPRQIRDPLCHEVENHILEIIKDEEHERMLLSDVIFLCAILSNFMYCSYSTRVGEELVPCLATLSQYVSKLLDRAACILEKSYDDLVCGLLGSRSIFETVGTVRVSFESFLCSPLFNEMQAGNNIDILTAVIQSVERLLKVLAKLYEGSSSSGSNIHSKRGDLSSSASVSSQDSHPVNCRTSMIIDMELDVNVGSKDTDSVNIVGKATADILVSSVNQRIEVISIITKLFSALPSHTWDVMFELMEKESDPRVLELIIHGLCQHPHWSSSRKFLNLITSLNDFLDIQANLKVQSLNVLAAICSLLESLLSCDGVAKYTKRTLSSQEKLSEEGLISLGDLVNKISENDLFDWVGRTRLIDCICNFILVDPQTGQSMIEKLLLMLHDPDYRVRLCFALRVGVLFQTWDGHFELFQDICSNFGTKLVTCSGEKLVMAKEVLAAGPQPRTILETTIVTLAHLALHSEKIELEAVFMVCVIAAINPCLRRLVIVALDNLSRELKYTSRSKYMEELMASILFSWVATGVSLASLLEARDLFVFNVETINFIQSCCRWLLPSLLLHGDISNMNWIAKVACEPLAEMIKNHFVDIFSVCIALHCSKKAGWEKGSAVLESSILDIAKISEIERDKLIKMHMVSIVNTIFSLASTAEEPVLPLFSKETIARAIMTVVDGFLEIDASSQNIGLIDKINIFRPDRVFTFIVKMHYKVSAAGHFRHKSDRLAGIEVLIDVLGHRVAVPSTASYLLNLIGQCLDLDALLAQCCRMICSLLKIFKIKQLEGTAIVLGEQLQFLISKLVICCVPSKSSSKLSAATSSQVLSLLCQLTLDSDPSLHEYIKELEPFPNLDLFHDIRMFHEELCQNYSPMEHLLTLGKRSRYLPPRLLLWSLKALHKKLFEDEAHPAQKNEENIFEDAYLDSDHEIVHTVWNLVHICSLNGAGNFGALVSDFISRVGIGDPHGVVFHLPIESKSLPDHNFHLGTCISDELLVAIMRLLKKYLMDDSVKIIDIASQALRGILSTENGQRALLSFDSYQRSLIEVHSKGVNVNLVQKLLADLERKLNAEALSLKNSAIWKTDGKTFETWICPLVCALIGYCDDKILRLCQDIVLVKSEVAELLFPHVMVNLSSRKDVDVDLCQLISSQVQANILTEENKLTKSIQVILDVLNELRLCHVMERGTSSNSSMRENSKQYGRPSSYGSKTRTTPLKAKHQTITSSVVSLSTLSWEKVYWIPVDYLAVARSAITSGAYFTAVLYVEHWCEENFNSLTLGTPDFSHVEILPQHIEILLSAVTQINEPDSLYGIIQSHKLTSQIITFEHEGNWSKALEYYDLQIRSDPVAQGSSYSPENFLHSSGSVVDQMIEKKPYKGLIRSLQQIGCTHLLDVYCQGLTSQKGRFQHDPEFTELQYEAAWRSGNWDFSLLYGESNVLSIQHGGDHFNENLHSCLRALNEGGFNEFQIKLKDSKQELLLSISHASEESTKYIYQAIVKLQILYHLGMAWDSRWNSSCRMLDSLKMPKVSSKPVLLSRAQLTCLDMDWKRTLKQAQLHMNLLEPFVAFRRVLLQILNCQNYTVQHLLESAATLRKVSRFSQAASALHEFKFLCAEIGEHSNLYWLGRLEEAKLLRAQGQHQMAINLAKYISENYQMNENTSDVFRLIGKWLAETRTSNSRTILEKYLKHAVALAENCTARGMVSTTKRSQMHFHLAHYADALFRSYEERLNSSEWQAAMRLRKHKTKELEALVKRFRSSTKGEKTDCSAKIQELQKQLAMDKEEAEKLQEDRDNFLSTALDEYKRCLVIGDKYDVRVVFRLTSLWFSLSIKPIVVDSMSSTISEVQSYKFIPLVYQIASRMGSTKDGQGAQNFQFALVSLIKKLTIDHPYHTIFQLLALANGDRIKDKQRSRSSFVVDMDKKVAAENLLRELSSYHEAVIRQMKQMVEIYIKLAELETKREDTNKKVNLPREIRSIRELELVPVVTANIPIDPSCQYTEGSFPHFKGLADSVTVMNGINAPKVVECFGSDGQKYRQLAKSGNDDLRQDAVMEQFFGLVNTFLQNHRDTWKRRLRIRTYKVVPFTPSAGVLEWVNGTLPLGEYLIGSRDGGAHGRYGAEDWTYMKCRQHMTVASDKRKAFQEVCVNFRPVMHHFFLERFFHPADWFQKRLTYTRSVAASSMVGYIVGLGDRHSMNILVDQATAEVVHIDLGVAFEQGLMLKTPERVPFRLSRDIIDGMGITGVEGVFRRCCEETLSVMRTNKEALLTIIEVFIHDPLYKWALSPLKALQRQKETDDDMETSLEGSQQDDYEGNKDAARALMRVKQKLDGYEEGEMRSVHGQVQQLIHDAIDPDRLCHMFPGWGAWL